MGICKCVTGAGGVSFVSVFDFSFVWMFLPMYWVGFIDGKVGFGSEHF